MSHPVTNKQKMMKQSSEISDLLKEAADITSKIESGFMQLQYKVMMGKVEDVSVLKRIIPTFIDNLSTIQRDLDRTHNAVHAIY